MIRLLCLVMLSTICTGVLTQEEYTMEDISSTECSGILTDTGGSGDDYGGGEFFVFTVNLAVGLPIEVTFLENVCLENQLDFLQIYDGPPDSGMLLTEVTGIDYLPDAVTAWSGMVSFIFQSDVSVNYCGFVLQWQGQAPPPIPPVVVASDPICGEEGLTWQITPAIACEAFTSDSVTTTGGIATGMAELICDGDSAVGFYVPFTDGPLTSNCSWGLTWNLGLTDACDSTHVLTITDTIISEGCPVSGSWINPPEEVCGGTCDTLWWTSSGCFPVTWEWSAISGGTVIDQGDSAGVVVCPENGPSEVVLVAFEATTGASTEFTWTISEQAINLETELPEALCTGSEPLELVATPAGGTWSGTVVEVGADWFLDAEQAALDGGLANISYITPLGCTLDTAAQVVVVDAGGPYATCVGAPPFSAEGTSIGISATWEGAIITSGGTIMPAFSGTYVVVFSGQGCADSTTVEIVELLPTLELGEFCANEEPVSLPVIAQAATWTGPGLNSSSTAFDPDQLPLGTNQWLCELTGCSQPATADVLPISAPANLGACPEGTEVLLTGGNPAGGTWSGPGVSSEGIFDPSIPGEGLVVLTYAAPNGCEATTSVFNVTTSIESDSYLSCTTASPINLVGSPECGDWSASWGSAGLSDGCDAYLDPSEIPVGEHELAYSLNGCSAMATVHIWPGTIDIPNLTLCNTADSTLLAPVDLDLGGSWAGAGVDSETGWFNPALALPTGSVTFTAPGGCISSAILISEPWQQVAPLSFQDTLCASTWFEPIWEPSVGTNWLWEGSQVDSIWSDTLAPGSYAVEVFWAGDYCASDTAFAVHVPEPLSLEISLEDDLICEGIEAEIGYQGTGGNPENHVWELTAPLPWIPDSSSWWVAQLSDGCSAAVMDSVMVQTLAPSALELITPDTACFGGIASVSASIAPAGAWELTWDTLQLLQDDVIENSTWWAVESDAGTSVHWNLSWPEESCEASGIYVVPSYAQVTTEVNWPQACVPWGELPVVLVNDGGGATTETWWVREPGTGNILDQINGPMAIWSPVLPGDYLVQLTASIDGECSESASQSICVLAPQQWFMADQFSPNGDNLNDCLGVRAHPLSQFSMRIINRWGELVGQFNEPQPGWDGQFNGRPAPTGIYVVQLDMQFTDGSAVTIQRHVTLVR